MPETQSEGGGRERTTPSVFAISAVFGGTLGMVAASAFGIDAGGGFIVGAVLVFMFLSIMVLMARVIERTAFIERVLDVILPSVTPAGTGGGDFTADPDIARALRRLIDRNS